MFSWMKVMQSKTIKKSPQYTDYCSKVWEDESQKVCHSHTKTTVTGGSTVFAYIKYKYTQYLQNDHKQIVCVTRRTYCTT